MRSIFSTLFSRWQQWCGILLSELQQVVQICRHVSKQSPQQCITPITVLPTTANSQCPSVWNYMDLTEIVTRVPAAILTEPLQFWVCPSPIHHTPTVCHSNHHHHSGDSHTYYNINTQVSLQSSPYSHENIRNITKLTVKLLLTICAHSANAIAKEKRPLCTQ